MAIYKNVEALEMVSYTATGHSDYDKGFADGLKYALEKLDALPEEDVELRNVGKWVAPSKYGYDKSWDGIGFICSECAGVSNSKGAYCPECGARMMWEKDGTNEEDR